MKSTNTLEEVVKITNCFILVQERGTPDLVGRLKKSLEALFVDLKECRTGYYMEKTLVFINLASCAVFSETPEVFKIVIDREPALVMHINVKEPLIPCFSWTDGAYNGEVVPPLITAVSTRSTLMVRTVLNNEYFCNLVYTNPERYIWEVRCAQDCAQRWYREPRKFKEKEILDILYSAVSPARL